MWCSGGTVTDIGPTHRCRIVDTAADMSLAVGNDSGVCVGECEFHIVQYVNSDYTSTCTVLLVILYKNYEVNVPKYMRTYLSDDIVSVSLLCNVKKPIVMSGL